MRIFSRNPTTDFYMFPVTTQEVPLSHFPLFAQLSCAMTPSLHACIDQIGIQCKDCPASAQSSFRCNLACRFRITSSLAPGFNTCIYLSGWILADTYRVASKLCVSEIRITHPNNASDVSLRYRNVPSFRFLSEKNIEQVHVYVRFSRELSLRPPLAQNLGEDVLKTRQQ